MGAKQLQDLKVGWYYNWSDKTKLTTDSQFVPMIFSRRLLDSTVTGDYFLAYNEPDHPKQANIAVEQAIADWATIAAKAKTVGSPAMAHDPIKSEWFIAFMNAKPKVDFIAVHWYRGASAKRFIGDMEAIHKKYNKPLWITEFAAQTSAQSKEEPGRYSQAEVDQFLVEVSRWMEATDYIQRYAWHDSKAGTSALFDESRDLTATGKTYAALKSGK